MSTTGGLQAEIGLVSARGLRGALPRERRSTASVRLRRRRGTLGEGPAADRARDRPSRRLSRRRVRERVPARVARPLVVASDRAVRRRLLAAARRARTGAPSAVADRFFVGDALGWERPRRFDFVRT